MAALITPPGGQEGYGEAAALAGDVRCPARCGLCVEMTDQVGGIDTRIHMTVMIVVHDTGRRTNEEGGRKYGELARKPS